MARSAKPKPANTHKVVGQSIAMVAVGAMAGVIAASAGGRLLQSMLFEVSPTDPTVLVGSCVVLVVVALFASAGPARRATRIDPVEAMRG